MIPPTVRPLSRRAAACAVVLALAGCSAERVTAPPFGEQDVSRREASPIADAEIESLVMVGDSITVGAAAELEAMFTAEGLAVDALDAQEGRRIAESFGDLRSGVDAVRSIVESTPPDLWVIALGTNDIAQYSPDQYGAVISDLLAELPGTAPVVWVDVYVDGSRDASREFNSELNRLLGARGRAAVAPWSTLAGAEGVLYDGVHPTDAGQQQYADVVSETVGALNG